MVKLNNSLKTGGGNLLKGVVADILEDDTRLFHCGEIKLRGFRNKFGMTINYNKYCHPEQSEGSLSVGEYPSPREGRGGSFKKCAFTLAEVLITLGIIGVVAAMTIPMLINHYKTKELEIRFKEADSILQQALKKTANEAGYDSISDLTIQGRTVTDTNLAELKKEVSETLNPIWLQQFTTITPLNGRAIYWSGKKCHGMTGSVFHMFERCWFSYGDNKAYQLQNGLTITGLSAQYGGVNHPGQVYFLFDTNGPYKGPNRWGHDIFLYYSIPNYNTMCNPTIKNSGNQTGCYYWAKKNQNPKDNSIPYWNVLYKPLSYWQKK